MSRRIDELERKIESLESLLRSQKEWTEHYTDAWKEEATKADEFEAALDQPIILPESLGLSVGAIVLMVENRMDTLAIDTGSDLDDYQDMARFVRELRAFIEKVLAPSEGHTEDEASAQFWKESTELYEDLTV